MAYVLQQGDMSHANAEKAGADQTLRVLRDAVSETALRGSTGRPGGVSPEEVLLTYLRKLSEVSQEPQHIQLAGAEVPQEDVRGMRSQPKPSGSPRRSGAKKQRGNEHSDPLQALSRLLARHGEAAWLAYRRSDAAPRMGWEDGIARMVHGFPGRVDRIRGLGNAVVPQVAEWIGRRILASLAGKESS
jgi:site-specific DNA-cytosine methylase